MKTIQKVFILLMAIAVSSLPTYPSFLGRFFTGITTKASCAARTRTNPTAHTQLYNSLQTLSAYQGALTPSAYPLKQLLSCYAAQIAHQKIYRLVLSSLSKNPEKLNFLIKKQVAQNSSKNNPAITKGLHHPKRWAKKNNQKTSEYTANKVIKQPSAPSMHTPVPTQQSTLGKLTSYFKKAPKPTLAEEIYLLAFLQGPVTASLAPIKTVIDKIKILIPDQVVYKKLIIALCQEHRPLFQELINAQKQNRLTTQMIRRAVETIQSPHVAMLTQPSLWSRFMSYFKKSSEPTLAQKVYYLAYKNGPVSSTEYPLKKVTQQLKKQISDPELYKQCIILLCTQHKALLQKLIDTQIKQQKYILEEKIRKGLEHSKYWAQRYHEGMEDIAASKVQSQEITALTTTPTIRSLQKTKFATTVHQPVVQNVQLIHPEMIEIIPAHHPLSISKTVVKDFDYEIYLPDIHTATPQLAKNMSFLPRSSKALSISATPTTALSSIQQAFKNEIKYAQHLTQLAPQVAPARVAAETKLLTSSPTKLIAENKQPAVSFAQAQQAFNHQTAQAQQLTQLARQVAPAPVAAETKQLTASRTKLIAENRQPAVSFAQAQHAFNHQAAQAQQLTQLAPQLAPAPVVAETKLLTSSPTKLIAENRQPAVSFAQAQQAFNHQTAQAQQLTQLAPQVVPTPVAGETKLLTASPTGLIAENKQPAVSFAQAQQAFNHQTAQAQQLTQLAPQVAPTPVAAETKLLTASPNKLIAENRQPTVSFAQAEHAFNHQTAHAQQLTQLAPQVVPAPVAAETKLLTSSPIKLIAENKQPAVSFAQAQHAFNHQTAQAQQLTQLAPQVAPARVAAETKLLSSSPTKLIAENRQPAVSFAQAQHAFNHQKAHAQQLTQLAPQVAPAHVAAETKLLTSSPIKLIAENKQPDASFAQAQHAFNHQTAQAQQLTQLAPQVAPTPVAAETKLLTASPTKPMAENRQAQQEMYDSSSHDHPQHTSYLSYKAATLGGIGGAWAWYLKDEPASITSHDKIPSKWIFGLGAIAVSGALIYKIIRDKKDSQEQDPEPSNDGSMIEHSHKQGLFEQNKSS